MGKQVVHTDLKRYLDYLERTDIFQYMTERQICQFISTLQPGRAIVKLANGEQVIAQFYERESVHTSHTPQVQAALNRYSKLSFKPASFGAYIGEDEEKPGTHPVAADKVSNADQVRDMLEQNPKLTVAAIVKLTGFSQSNVSRVRHRFLAQKRHGLD
jgi:glutamine synthetase adenylyltransferase